MIDEMIDLVRLVPDVNSCEKKNSSASKVASFSSLGITSSQDQWEVHPGDS